LAIGWAFLNFIFFAVGQIGARTFNFFVFVLRGWGFVFPEFVVASVLLCESKDYMNK